MLIVQGDADTVVPPAQSQALIAALRSNGGAGPGDRLSRRPRLWRSQPARDHGAADARGELAGGRTASVGGRCRAAGRSARRGAGDPLEQRGGLQGTGVVPGGHCLAGNITRFVAAIIDGLPLDCAVSLPVGIGVVNVEAIARFGGNFSSGWRGPGQGQPRPSAWRSFRPVCIPISVRRRYSTIRSALRSGRSARSIRMASLSALLCAELPSLANGLAKIEDLPGGGKGMAVTIKLRPRPVLG